MCVYMHVCIYIYIYITYVCTYMASKQTLYLDLATISSTIISTKTLSFTPLTVFVLKSQGFVTKCC